MEEKQKPIDDIEASTTDDTSDGSNPNRKRIVIAASIAAVLVLAAVGGGYAYADMNVGKGMRAAQAYAQSIDQQLTDKLKEAQTLLDGTTKEQVADEATLTKLADAVKTAGSQQGTPDDGSNPYMVWTLLNMQTAYDTDTQQAQSAIESLDKTMDAVTTSINDKQLADAQAKLDKLVADAQKLYDSTDGKVQNNATRDALKTALDNAKKGGADADALNKLATALNDAQTKVNDSVKAKEQADAEVQAEAAANEAASANTGYTGGDYSGGGYSGGGYTGGGYSGGGYSGGYTGGGNTGQSVNGTGGQWFGGNSVNGIYGYDDIGGAWTPLEGDSWEFTDSW